MEHSRKFRVLVIGAGNAGLALAQGLRNEGIACIVFERDSQDDFLNKTRDWGMLLHWGGEYLASYLLPPDMRARIKEPRVDPCYVWTDPLTYVNAKTGEVILRVPVSDITRVSRKKLRKFLSEGLDIRCSKKLREVRTTNYGVTAIFEDGTEESGDLIVGSDGSRSKIREHLVGADAAKPEDTDFNMINYSFDGYTAEQARLLRTIHPIVKLAPHPDMHTIMLLAVLDVPEPERPDKTRFQVYMGWKGEPYAHELHEPAARMAFLREKAAAFCEPFRTAVMATPETATLPIDRGQQWKPIEWDNSGGRVTLAGDAAHSMLPHRGQGLNNAIQDAAEIVKAVKSIVYVGVPQGKAIDAYEAEMRQRGRQEVELSFQTAETGSSWKTFTESPIFKLGHQKSSI